MRVSVQQVASRADMREFIRWPMALYRADPFFVPPLLSERRRFFSRENPIFAFTDVAYFLARDERRRVVGRVTAHINRNHNEFHNEHTGFFGFFECIESLDVARALMESAETWLRERAMTVIRGPFNFSTNEECGFLAEGFDSIPAIMMPYTKPYYLDFMAAMGYQPAKDLLAYDYSGTTIPERFVRFAERAEKATGVVVRMLDMKRFDEEVERIFQVYNRAWEKNWGFIPMTHDEFRYAATDLRQIVDPHVVLVAEKDGVAVGCSVALPDYNPVFRKMNGRLLPFGIFHFLLGRRAIHRVRVITLGVVEEYRKQGVDALLIYHTFKNGLPRGYNRCEMSWVLADNMPARRMFERIGARAYKTYRLIEKAL